MKLQRPLCLLLLLAFGLPTVAPALGMADDAQAHLAACCRRNGAHHCTQGMDMADTAAAAATPDTPAVSARCPYCPSTPAIVSQARDASLALPAASPHALPLHSLPFQLRQTEARARVALDRARHKRGPPAVVLS